MSLHTDLRSLLDGTPIAHVATILPDGAPHSVPVWIGTHGEHVVFMTGPGSQKARNLRRDPRVSISLTQPDNPFVPVRRDLHRAQVESLRQVECFVE